MTDVNNQIAIYIAENGQTQIDVRVQDDTVWLTQDAISKLFGTTIPNINMHIKNIISEGELDENSTIKDFLIVRSEGKRRVSRQISHYNLDMILSVGYRVKSKTATQFRIWATKTLKDYLLNGYVVNQQMLSEQKSKMLMLQKTLDLMSRSIENQAQTIDQAQQVSRVLNDFVKGLNLLDDFDHKTLDFQGKTESTAIVIPPDEFLSVVDKMKGNFASDVFAKPKDESFYSSIGQIYQTFDGKDLYPTLEEKAANLLYLIVKNHSFVDGNKRIGASCFLYFLDKNKILYGNNGQNIIDSATLFALTLLIAESTPSEADTVKQVVISILNRRP
ncbi:MAG: virulence protein RhuM/Fic/DOC family protein [Alphaproteobacteria bacterium]|nr:virulence protein RhuM/Fic/DOC family protein [Alphaproteobacteria bacterium]